MPGVNTWLSTRPSIFFFHMVSNDFSTALCIRLCLSHLLILGVSHCICSQPLDPMGIHLFHCIHGGEKMVSHDVVRDVFTAIGKSARFHVSQGFATAL